MIPIEMQSYSPVLRPKGGERDALIYLDPTVRPHLLPYWVLCPPGEKDQEKRRPLTNDELIHENARRIGYCWPLRPCLVDPRFLYSRLGDDSRDWLPNLYRAIAAAHGRAIPVASLSDFSSASRVEGLKKAVDPTNIGLALRLTLDETMDSALPTQIQSALRALVARPDQTVLVIDGSGSHLDLETTPEVVSGVILKLMETGLWRRIIFQSTSYPEANPAKPNTLEILPRPEFGIWRRVRETDPTLRENVMFGDFGADSAKFHFESVNIAPIRHFRICTSSEWLVPRGENDVPHRVATRTAATHLVSDARYSGRAFSWGDNFLFERSNGFNGPGSSTTWRAVNTNHHLTMVVRDIGTLNNFEIGRYAHGDFDNQMQLMFDH